MYLWREDSLTNSNDTWEPIMKFQAHDKYITNIAFKDEKTLMTSSSDGTLRLWSMENDEKKRQTNSTIKDGNDKGEKCGKENEIIETINEGEEAREMAMRIKNYQGHEGWVWDFKFSADGAYMVSVGSDSIARLWDVESGEVISIYVGHQKTLTSVALNDLTFTAIPSHSIAI